jgi:hypothetical protein
MTHLILIFDPEQKTIAAFGPTRAQTDGQAIANLGFYKQVFGPEIARRLVNAPDSWPMILNEIGLAARVVSHDHD